MAKALIEAVRQIQSTRRVIRYGSVVSILLGILTITSVGVLFLVLGVGAAIYLFKMPDKSDHLVSRINSLRARPLPEEIKVGDVISVNPNAWGLSSNLLLAKVVEVHSEDSGVAEILSEPIFKEEHVAHAGRSFTLERGDRACFHLVSPNYDVAGLWAEIGDDGKPIITW